MGEEQDQVAAIQPERINQGWNGVVVGLPDLQYSTVDSFTLEASMGAVRGLNGEIEPERDRQRLKTVEDATGLELERRRFYGAQHVLVAGAEVY